MPEPDPAALAAHVEHHYPMVRQAADAVRAYAEAWLAQRDRAWHQVVDEVRLWVAAARSLPEQQRALGLVRSTRAWLKSAGDAIRNDRIAPFAAHSQKSGKSCVRRATQSSGP